MPRRCYWISSARRMMARADDVPSNIGAFRQTEGVEKRNTGQNGGLERKRCCRCNARQRVRVDSAERASIWCVEFSIQRKSRLAVSPVVRGCCKQRFNPLPGEQLLHGVALADVVSMKRDDGRGREQRPSVWKCGYVQRPERPARSRRMLKRVRVWTWVLEFNAFGWQRVKVDIWQ